MTLLGHAHMTVEQKDIILDKHLKAVKVAKFSTLKHSLTLCRPTPNVNFNPILFSSTMRKADI